jgi:SAM-dependent methyltransferase
VRAILIRRVWHRLRRGAIIGAARLLPRRLEDGVLTRTIEVDRPHWIREVMVTDTRRELEALNPAGLHVCEVSGHVWTDLPWGRRTQLDYPDFDLCAPPDELPGPFDLVICEQVLEHVLDPVAAVRTLRRLCKPGGHVYVSTPFLVRLHDCPGDYWRFTPDGMAHLLRSQGLDPVWVRSWGNRQALKANLRRWVSRFPWQSLRNDPDLPIVVWSLSRPAGDTVLR